ncbi:MAG: DUF72 domain-containing protein [Armatimonadetes bacterium]|nr:DUF72 domain-containing protein [Armatimonadota bacterium]
MDGRIRLGTIGFAYEDWRGNFYPAELAVKDRLAYYATQFPAIELDTTFYALPTPETVVRWRESVPPDFVFSLKAPKALTHESESIAKAIPIYREFERLLFELGSDRCIGLLQFGPAFAAGARQELATLLSGVSPGVRLAIEFRHPSWWTGATQDLLASCGVCWVDADLVPAGEVAVHPEQGRYRPIPALPTTPWRYLRLCGLHAQHLSDAHEVADPSVRLNWWLERVPADQGMLAVCGNSYAGHGPGTADRLAAKLSLPPRAPMQPTLF